MEAVGEVTHALPDRLLEPFRLLLENSYDSHPVDAVIFVGLSLVLGIVCRHVLGGTRVPYTVALLIIGIALGSLEYGTNHKLGKLGDGIRLWAEIDADLLLAVFLPALLFESAFSMEVHQIKRCMAQMILLAGPGVLISTFCLGLALKEAAILIWSGLRGVVALALSLSFKNSSMGLTTISSETRSLFVFFTGGIVFLTLIINGSTTQFILHFLGMNKLSETKRCILDYTKYKMLKKLEAFEDLGDDEELGPADWPTVKRYIANLNTMEEGNLDPTNLKDIRIRLLNVVQAAYRRMLEEGRITQATAKILMQSVDEAIDVASHEPLCDWKGLKAIVNFPNYYKFLQTRMFPQKLVTHFTVKRLESACYICAALLLAHRIAQRQLRDFLGDSSITSIVINESVAEGEEAREFLEDGHQKFPEVLRVVKTRQVTYSVLNHLIDYVHNLEKDGLLEEKEMLHLHDAVQTDLKRLLRNPPPVRPFPGPLP